MDHSIAAATSTAEQVGQAANEFFEAIARGEQPSITEFAARFPDIADDIRRAFPALLLVGGASSGDPSNHVSCHRIAEQTLGDFRIIGELGRGGMGTVYEAEQMSLGRRVALKVLPFAALVQDKSLQRFRNEVRAAAALDHPHIVAAYSVGEERGVHFYAMQLIRGQTLADVIDELRRAKRDATRQPEGPISHVLLTGSGSQASERQEALTIDSAARPRQATTHGRHQAEISTAVDSQHKYEFYRSAARLGIQAAEALQHAHEQGVLHRDIKPSNLMLDREAKLYVTDFGLARIEADAGLTMTGDLLGTLRYMAPEQALAKRVVIDHRADIYSLGTTLYELLTLEPAFGETDRSELLKQIAFEEPRPLRKLDRRIPAELETIVLKSMAKNPDERYQTAQQLADDLRALLENRPIKAKPPSTVDRAIKWARRHTAVVWSAIVTLLVCGFVVAGSVGWSIRDQQTRQAAVEAKVLLALEEAKNAYQQDRLPFALAAVRQAESLLTTSHTSPEIQLRVRDWHNDLDLVQRLEEIQLEKAAIKNNEFDIASAPPNYAKVFADYELDLIHTEVAKITQFLSQSSIKRHLVAAIDDWAALAEGEARKRLLAVARAVDSDSWRNQLRDAIEREDGEALKTLAEDEAAVGQAPSTIITLASLLAKGEESLLAANLLYRAHRVYPSDFWINHRLGTLLNHESAGEAAGFLRIALSHRKDDGPTHNNLGVALMGLGKLEEAEEEFQAAVKLQPEESVFRINLTVALAQQEKFAAAEMSARAAIKLAPEQAIAHYFLAESLAKQDKLAAAIKSYRDAIRLEPKVRDFYLELALIFFQQNDVEQATQTLQQFVAIDPADGDSYFRAAQILFDQRVWEEAVAAYREATRLLPYHEESHAGLAASLASLGHLEEAEANFEKLRLLNPPKFETLRHVGEYFAIKGKYVAAAERLTKAVAADPDDSALLMRLALARLASGDWESYEQLCREMTERFSATGDAQDFRRVCWVCTVTPKVIGDIEDLVRLADRALKDPGERWLTCRERGLVAYRAGDWEGAIKWSQESREIDRRPAPIVSKPMNSLVEAMALRQMGKHAEAESLYEKTVSLAPKQFIRSEWVEWIVWEHLRDEAAQLFEQPRP